MPIVRKWHHNNRDSWYFLATLQLLQLQGGLMLTLAKGLAGADGRIENDDVHLTRDADMRCKLLFRALLGLDLLLGLDEDTIFSTATS